MRRRTRRDEQDTRKPQLYARRFGQREVPVMRRIKGAAEDAETRLTVYS